MRNSVLQCLILLLGCFTLPAIAQTKVRLAVLECDVSLDGQKRSDMARFLTDELSGKIDSLEVVTVVDYQNLPEAMKFLEDIQKTRSPEQYAAQLGKMIGVDQIVIPRVLGLSSSYRMTAKLIDVATGRSLKVYEAKVSGGTDHIPELVEQLAEALRADSNFGRLQGVEEAPLPAQAGEALATAEAYLRHGENTLAVAQVDAARKAWANDLRVLERCASLYDQMRYYDQAISVLDQWVKEAKGGKSPGQAKMEHIEAWKAAIDTKRLAIVRAQNAEEQQRADERDAINWLRDNFDKLCSLEYSTKDICLFRVSAHLIRVDGNGLEFSNEDVAYFPDNQVVNNNYTYTLAFASALYVQTTQVNPETNSSCKGPARAHSIVHYTSSGNPWIAARNNNDLTEKEWSQVDIICTDRSAAERIAGALKFLIKRTQVKSGSP